MRFMSSIFRTRPAVLMLLLAGTLVGTTAEGAPLRVCADPNNLPFSDQAGGGFENKLAELVASEIGGPVTYTWWAQRRGFVRNTLKAQECDVVMGVPAGYDLVLATKPYYRSSYVLVSRADRHLGITSLKDPRLRNLKIGVHLIGDDGTNTPPAQALGALGIVDNVTGFSIYGDYRQNTPPARLIEAVQNSQIDVAAVWGPLAGYAASRSSIPLDVEMIADGSEFAPLEFQFDIAMGVRKGDRDLQSLLDKVISRRRADIRSVLTSYAVPMLPTSSLANGASR
jgi:mxaJ protein